MKFAALFVSIFFLLVLVSPVFAYDPTSHPNNKFGIHILFPTELAQAAKLVNSSSGDWGYVTIPIQYDDRDLVKWQQFMNDCQTYHLIPIIRLATDPFYGNTSVWRKPDEYDVLDFANFLNSLNWPVKNRYVILFNEPNRYDEWGGEPPSPQDYASLVAYAESEFKQTNPDFYLITAGMDNASPNDGVKYLDNFVYLRDMGNYNPNVFKNIDGIASHSYPNPGFSQPPSDTKPESTSTYKYEENIVAGFAGSQKPIFITETGWSTASLSQDKVSQYLKDSMTSIWGTDQSVVAVTPFLLESENGGFDKFSFSKGDSLTDSGKTYQSLAKVKGDPEKTEIKIPKQPIAKSAISERFAAIPAKLSLSSSLMKSYFKALFTIGK